MTEYEILDLISNDSEQMAIQFSIYLSVMSGYLLVAYFAGEKLTTVQVLILSGLFLFATVAEVWGFHLTLSHIGELLAKKAELGPLSAYEEGIDDNGYPWAIAMSIGIIAALYFMWSVRHPRLESNE